MASGWVLGGHRWVGVEEQGRGEDASGLIIIFGGASVLLFLEPGWPVAGFAPKPHTQALINSSMEVALRIRDY